MDSAFNGAHLKIDRATEHIQELQARAKLFGDENPHRIAVDTDLKTGHNLLRIAPAEPFPPIFVGILGDALRKRILRKWK